MYVSVVFPAVIFEHMNEFNDELALLVLLTVLIRMFILPAQCCFTTEVESEFEHIAEELSNYR